MKISTSTTLTLSDSMASVQKKRYRQQTKPLLFTSWIFALLFLITTGVNAQTTGDYCVPQSSNGNTAYINAVQLGTINSVTGRNTDTYTSYTSASAANQTTNLGQGSQERIIISLSGGYHVDRTNQAYVWIDYNQDGDFDDAGELVGSGSHRYDGDVVLTFTVPITALPGATRLRVRNTQDYGDPLGSCETIWDSETEDYAVTIVVPTPCAGTPTLGATATSNAGPLCSGMSFNLSVDPYPVFASGTTYQWQVSTAGATGPFTAIAGQTYPTATITGQMQSSWYRLAATCANSGLTGVSSPVNVTQQPNIAACYCVPVNQGDNTWDYIQAVQLGTINNISGKNTSVYTSYVSDPAPNLTTSMIQGSQQTITISGVVDRYITTIAAWIDFNGDGDFNDAGEQVANGFIGSYDGASFTASFTVPLTAIAGPTRMRVRSSQNGYLDPCAATRSGEAEDYPVTIVTPCSVQPVTTSINASGSTTLCQGNSVILTASGADTYLWSNGDTTSSITVGSADTYSVTGSNAIGCSNTSAPVTVTTGTPANAGTAGTLTVCDGTTLTNAQLFAALGGSPGAGGSWSPALAGAGIYTYTVAATAPCTGNATATVTVNTINKTIKAGCYSATIARTYNPSANTTTFTYNACANGCAASLGYIAFITQSNLKVLAPLNGATYRSRNTYTVSAPVGKENGRMVYGIKYSVAKGTGIKNRGECDNFTFTLAGNISVDAITVRFKAGTAVINATAECPLNSSSITPAMTSLKTAVGEQVLEAPAKLTVSAYPNPYTDKVKFVIQSPVSGPASLEVFTLLGQKVQTVFHGHVEAGSGKSLEYNVPVANRANLIYILRVGDQQATGKLIHPN